MSTNTIFYLILAIIAGITVPTQGALNNKMAGTVESPILAALLSFVMGTTALVIYVLLSGTPIGNLALTRNASAISWTGGLFGAFFVTSTVLLIPRIGVAMTFGLVVAGQMLASLVFDHFGLLGVEVKPVSVPRVIGVVLVVAGVALIRRF
jgi:transporter family-2 protein